MKILLLFSGLLRSFVNNILLLEKELEKIEPFIHYDIFICCCPEDNCKLQDELKEHRIKHIKLIKEDDLIDHNTLNISNGFDISNVKVLNTMKQWYKLWKIFSYVPEKEYDYIVRMRPDILIGDEGSDIKKIFDKLKNNTMYIPSGNDIFDTRIFNNIGFYNSTNDQICIGSYDIMKIYSDMYLHLEEYSRTLPFISEVMLCEHLKKNKVKVERFELNYKLILSKCNLITISGDSGSGKSTLSNILKPIFKFDKLLFFETDRYHKWARGDKNWEMYTHLHPDANLLEQMSGDATDLKLGKSIYVVDYDHEIGKFVRPELIESNDYILMCGLHTLYLEDIVCISDIKIYIDTHDELKRIWKIKRDVCERGYSVEKVINNLTKREIDFKKYIDVQKNCADIVVRYYCDNEIDLYKYNDPINVKLKLMISEKFYENNYKKINNNGVVTFVKNDFGYECITDNMQIPDETIKYINSHGYIFINKDLICKDSLALLQFLIILIIYD